jgi:hypothetical protein
MFALTWFTATIINTLLAAWLVVGQRHVLLRPSVQVSLFYLVFVVWPTCAQLDEVESLLPDPHVFTLLSQVLVFLPLIAAAMRDHALTSVVWENLVLEKFNNYSHERAELPFLLMFTVLVFVWYFSVVPLTSTGLYVAFTDPADAALAREQSFKLLESAGLRYAFAFFSSVVAPVLLILVLAALSRRNRGGRARRMLAGVMAGVAILVLTLLISITGARSFAATLWFTAMVAFWLSRGLSARIALRLGFAIVLLLTMPVTLTMAREGKLDQLPLFLGYFWDFVRYRVFTGPAEVASWYVHYAETEGFVGLAATPKLAELFGYAPVDVPNLIGRVYYGGSLLSINANTGFAFAYYSYFGFPGWALSVVGLFLLDGVLYVYTKLRGILLLACVATTSVSALAFTYAEFTTVLLTHGFLLAPVACLVLSRATRLFQRSRAEGAA